MFIMFGQHAREMITSEVALKLIQTFCNDKNGSVLNR